MRKLVLATSVLFLSTAALADRYGIDEIASDGGATPTWVLGLLLVALLVYHFKEVSQLSSATAGAKHEAERLAAEIGRLRRELAQTQERCESEVRCHIGLQSVVERYFDGLLSDEEFFVEAKEYVWSLEWKREDSSDR